MIKKQLNLQNTPILLSIIKKRKVRNCTLRFSQLGGLKLTVPRYLSNQSIQDILAQNTNWILEKFRNSLATKSSAPSYLEHKRNSYNIVYPRVLYFAELLGVVFKKLTIKNQISRWGSCSSLGNININYKVLFLTAELRDYVIVHELCHLKEFNHSGKFWKLVGDILPNYRSLRKELKNNRVTF